MDNIPEPEEIVEPEEHKARRAALRTLEKSVIDLGKVKFLPSELQDVKIRAVPAEFPSNGKSSLNPCFFEPYSGLLIKPEEGYVETEYPEYDDPVPNDEIDITPIVHASELCDYLQQYLPVYRSQGPETGSSGIIAYNSGWDCKDIYEYGFAPLWESNEPQWRVDSISHYSVGNLPHISCTLTYDINGDDDTLLRGELLTLIRIMRGRMRHRDFIEHDVVPVIVFSMMGPQHVRIIQGHFNGNELVVYYSKLYNFEHEKDAPMDFFARWYSCKPTGQTTSKK